MQSAYWAYTVRRNPDDDVELRVMDRETGKPLDKVKVILNGKYNRYNPGARNTWTDTTISGNSNKEGLFIASTLSLNMNLSFRLQVRGDTLVNNTKYVNGAEDKSDDEPEDKTVLFADRQIYRPGQTIYFKGLQLQTLNGKTKIIPGKDVEVAFLDVNNKQVSSLKFTTNEFGTFSGSFIIPQNMLDGDVELKTDDGSIDLKVEEYKRPTFQVTFLTG